MSGFQRPIKAVPGKHVLTGLAMPRVTRENRSHEKMGSQGWREEDFQEPVCSMKSCGERCFLGSFGHRAFEEIEKQHLSSLKGSQRMGKDSQAGGK